MLIGAPAWIEQFEKIRLPYNINVLTQAAAEFSLRHYDVLMQQTAILRQERQRLTAALNALPLERVWESEANFVLIKTVGDAARSIFEKMKEQGVLIKCLDGSHPLLQGCLRLTVGKPEENDQMLAALAAAL